jgi:hypothetical protein
MECRIVAFHQDPDSHWVADLECGHGQHVRHDPPWQVREWVLTEESRRAYLGMPLDCVICDRDLAGLSADAADRYRDARLQGLCHDGALEAARKT